MKKAIMSVLIITFIMGCANGSGMKVIIKPALDRRLKEIKPISLHAGLFIEPAILKFKIFF
jgi:capsular polysaccharide biosynthesis protein